MSYLYATSGTGFSISIATSNLEVYFLVNLLIDLATFTAITPYWVLAAGSLLKAGMMTIY